MITIYGRQSSRSCLYRGFQRTGWADGADLYYRTSLRNSQKNCLEESHEVTYSSEPGTSEVRPPTILFTVYSWVAVNHDYIFRRPFHSFKTIFVSVVYSAPSDFAVHRFRLLFFVFRFFRIIILYDHVALYNVTKHQQWISTYDQPSSRRRSRVRF